MNDIAISQEPIELHKLLKFAGLVGTGGEAKFVIQDGEVLVNGEVETQRRKKIVEGDVVAYRDATFQVVLAEDDED